MNHKNSRRTQLHGVAVSVNGAGVLILGDSGTGKSAVAFELIKHGHKLIADDAVLLKTGARGELIAEPHALIAGLLEIRDFGVISVSEVFGESALASKEIIEMFVSIEPKIERIAAEQNRMDRFARDFAGVRIPGFIALADKSLETADRIERKTGLPVSNRVHIETAAPPLSPRVNYHKQELFLNR